MQALTLRFLAVLDDNSLRDTYIKVRLLTFNRSIAGYYVHPPTEYPPGG